MKRGISFEIPNKYGSFLGEILKPFEMTEFIWRIGDEGSYLLKDDKLGEPLFPNEINGMDGLLLKGLLEDNEYYLIFADLKAYRKGKNSADIETYEEFLNSDCQLVLLVVDSAFVTLYCKDNEKLESLYHNAKLNGFYNLKYITDENDTRTVLSVW